MPFDDIEVDLLVFFRGNDGLVANNDAGRLDRGLDAAEFDRIAAAARQNDDRNDEQQHREPAEDKEEPDAEEASGEVETGEQPIYNDDRFEPL